MEALHTPFAIDEGAGRFGERRDGKEHVCVGCPVLEGAHHDDELRFLQRRAGSNRICAIELGFRVQQEISATRIGEHRLRIETAAFGNRIREIAADSVRRLGQHSKCGAGHFTQRLGECGDLRCIRMLDRDVPQEYRSL